MKALALAAMIALGAAPAFAIGAGEALDDPVLEARARALGKELRCLVCQNQSIDDSDADLARDLRRLVRERLVAGENEAQIKAYLVSRYGDFILLKPPFKPKTYILWLGPGAILVFAGGGVVLYLRRHGRRGPPAAPLTDAERRRLEALLDDT